VTQFAALIYSLLVVRGHLDALLANVVSTVCGVCAGYVVHSRWSFADGAATGESGKMLRFSVSTLAAFLLNSFSVWLLVSRLHLSPLTPVPVMMLATPWISFLVNRHWVFKAASQR
jgi:putative flippase GtrA